MEEVHVVTCFLLRQPSGRAAGPGEPDTTARAAGPSTPLRAGLGGSSMNAELLLLKRGKKVGSYRGRWAGVSGYMERPPLEQAYIEIAEETGLGREEVELLREGSLLAVEDPALSRRWIVHPFLFLVHAPEKLRLDWEHQEARWVNPRHLRRYRTVPGLAEALARALPPGEW